MRITSINTEPITEVQFLNAGRRPGGYYVDRLPVHEAIVDRLPDGVSAIIATADLQGRERFGNSNMRPPRLLGEVLPQMLTGEILPELRLPPGEIGVLLAGDFYTVPALDKRGGSGDVTSVWWAFEEQFDWTVGVAGNHDTFGPEGKTAPRFSAPLHYLDGDRVNLHGLKIAGLGGIIGNPKRVQRRTEEGYLQTLEGLLEHRTDILITHDGPDAPSTGCRGSSMVRQLIERLGPSLVVRGHAHWKLPFAELAGGVQVLNVDARVVVMREKPRPRR